MNVKEFRLEVFGSLEDAIIWLENTLYELELDYEFLKGEITYINSQWRASVMVDDPQLELPIIPEYR